MLEIIGLISTLTGILLSIGSGLLWWSAKKSDAEVKRYAAQREFGHIKNSLTQLIANLDNQYQDIERRLDDIKNDIQEIKFECRIDKK